MKEGYKKTISTSPKESTPGSKKILEYAKRIESGEDEKKVLQGLPKVFVDGVNELLAEANTETGEEGTGSSERWTEFDNADEAISFLTNSDFNLNEYNQDQMPLGIQNEILEHFIRRVPTKWKGLPIELLEYLWVDTQFVDNEKNKENLRIRELALFFYQQKNGRENVDDSEEIFEVSSSIEHNKSFNIESNVERISVQEAFGDMNGSYRGFVEHLLNRGVVSQQEGSDELIWTGDDKKVVFVGDILGDRTPEGFKIYNALQNLSNQAQASGGEVRWLSGNHENMCNAVLGGFTTEFGGSVEHDMKSRLTLYSGNLEYGKYLPDDKVGDFVSSVVRNKDKILNDQWDGLIPKLKKRKSILESIRKNPDVHESTVASYEKKVANLENKVNEFYNIMSEIEGGNAKNLFNRLLSFSDRIPNRILSKLGNDIIENRNDIKLNIESENPGLLEALSSQEVIILQDDVLYTHTKFTSQMAEMIFEVSNGGKTMTESLESINSFYQKILKWYMSPEPRELEVLPENEILYFNRIRDTFLSTSEESRISYWDEKSLLDEESKQEVTDKLKALGVNFIVHGHDDNKGEKYGHEILPMLSVDRSAYKSEEGVIENPIANVKIDKSGKVSYF